MKDKKITPEYTRRAIEKYRAGRYGATVSFPKEYKEILQAQSESVNGYINRLVREDLTRRGLLQADACADDPGAESSGAWGGMV